MASYPRSLVAFGRHGSINGLSKPASHPTYLRFACMKQRRGARLASSLQVQRPSTAATGGEKASENPRDIQLAWKQQGATGPPPPPKSFRVVRSVLAALLYLALGAGVATAVPIIQLLRDAMKVPTDEQTLGMFRPEPGTLAATVEAYIQDHPLTKACMADRELRPSRPHLKVPESMREVSLTSGTLLGEGKLEVPPLAFSTADGSRFISIQYVGPALCGHPGIVHGGLLATLLDEGLARCCFAALPNKVGVTASLKMDYLKPCLASQYIVLRAETTKVDGRKAWVRGWIETLPAPQDWQAETVDGEAAGQKPVKLVSAEALFIEPKKLPLLMKAYSTHVEGGTKTSPSSSRAG